MRMRRVIAIAAVWLVSGLGKEDVSVLRLSRTTAVVARLVSSGLGIGAVIVPRLSRVAAALAALHVSSERGKEDVPLTWLSRTVAAAAAAAGACRFW